MTGTKATAGVPFHVTRVEFETTARPDSEPAAKYAANLLARTVGQLEKVPVGEILSAYLEQHYDDWTGPDDLEEIAGQLLLLTTLIETVLDQARTHLRTGLAIDIATTLLPRLKGTRS